MRPNRRERSASQARRVQEDDREAMASAPLPTGCTAMRCGARFPCPDLTHRTNADAVGGEDRDEEDARNLSCPTHPGLALTSWCFSRERAAPCQPSACVSRLEALVRRWQDAHGQSLSQQDHSQD